MVVLHKGGDIVPTIKKNHLVQKRNVLNEIRANSMTLQELRFFSIYLSKIHKDRPEETRLVRFPMDDFKAIMELGRIDIKYMKGVTNSLLGKVVNVPDERGGYVGFQIFKRCKVSTDDSGEWYVEINAHDDALPLMFEFKDKYFSYQLWNALRLKSSNQLRMYEILKQYQTIGYRILTIEELKELLGIGKDEYPRWNNFKTRVLDACQQALTEHTDIKFTYEPCGKLGKGGKILSLKFTIEKNEDFMDQLTLDMFIDEQKAAADFEDQSATVALIGVEELAPEPQNRYAFLAEAFGGEFSNEEVEVLYLTALPYIEHKHRDAKYDDLLLKMYDYFMLKYAQLKAKKNVKNRYSMLRIFMENDAKKAK